MTVLSQPAGAPPSMSSPPRRIARTISEVEPLLVLALLPFVWFPRWWWSGGLLLLIPLLWGVRWYVHGRPLARSPYIGPAVCLLLILPLTLLPVFEWRLAGPKLLMFVFGLGLTFALTNALTSRRLVLLGVYATAIVIGGGVALAGLIGTEWTAGKAAVLDPLYSRMPTLLQGFTRYGSRGAIHPNEIGGVLTLLVPLTGALTLGVWSTGGWRGERRLTARTSLLASLIALNGLFALVLVLTLSRSAFMGLAAGLTLVLAWWLVGIRRSPRQRRLGIATLLGIAVVAVGAGWRLVASWTATTDSSLDSFPSRLELWQRATLMLQDFPFTGIGMGQFEPVLYALYVPLLTPPGTFVPHAHSFLLQLGLDLGIPGALAFLWLLVGFFRGLWGASRCADDPELRAAAVGLAAGLASFLVYGLTDAIAVGSRGSIVMWLVLGLGAALACLRVCATPQTD